MKDTFVVIEIGGAQHIVSEGEEIDVNHIDGKTGDKIKIDDVYLKQDDKSTEVGDPKLGYSVTAEILSQFKGKKVQSRTYKAKSRYRRKVGYRPSLTKLRISKIAKTNNKEQKDKETKVNNKNQKDKKQKAQKPKATAKS